MLVLHPCANSGSLQGMSYFNDFLMFVYDCPVLEKKLTQPNLVELGLGLNLAIYTIFEII